MAPDAVPRKVKEYLDSNGRSPFGEWFKELNAPAAAKVVVALERIEQGNFSNVKSLGGGLSEYRIDFGPGYRIYFGEDVGRIGILLRGGTKKHQRRDIAAAELAWEDYKRGKRWKAAQQE